MNFLKIIKKIGLKVSYYRKLAGMTHEQHEKRRGEEILPAFGFTYAAF